MAVAAAMSMDRGLDHIRQVTAVELAAILEGGPDSAGCASISRAANVNRFWAYGAIAYEALRRGITIRVPVQEETS
jgi:hypothetical protein